MGAKEPRHRRRQGGESWKVAGMRNDSSALSIAPANNADRRQLVTDLVETFFRAAQNNSEFISLDDGLSVMSHHARELGFDAVILFLDELILWLASHAADPSFVAREGQKLVKLVEASKADRPIPLVSFIAKQREIADLVRDQVTGAQLAAIGDVLALLGSPFRQYPAAGQQPARNCGEAAAETEKRGCQGGN